MGSFTVDFEAASASQHDPHPLNRFTPLTLVLHKYNNHCSLNNRLFLKLLLLT